MKRLVLSAAALLLTALPADAGDRRPVRRVLGAVVRPLVRPEGRVIVRDRSAVRVVGPAVTVGGCGPQGCPVPSRGK